MMGRGRWENRKVTDGMEQADGQGGSGLAAVVVGSTFSSSRHKSSENSHTRGALAKTTGDEVRTIARFSTKVMGRNQKKKVGDRPVGAGSVDTGWLGWLGVLQATLVGGRPAGGYGQQQDASKHSKRPPRER
jgi:hypothetical protein